MVLNIHHGMLWHYVHYACFYQELGLLCYDSNKLDIQWKFELGHSRLKKTGLEITTVITMSIFHETLTNRLIRFVAVVQIFPRLNVLFRLFDDTARKTMAVYHIREVKVKNMGKSTDTTWWHYAMDALSTLLAFCGGKSAVYSPLRGPSIQPFHVFSVASISKLLNKQSYCQ